LACSRLMARMASNGRRLVSIVASVTMVHFRFDDKILLVIYNIVNSEMNLWL
jgi:hypothetical protein